MEENSLSLSFDSDVIEEEGNVNLELRLITISFPLDNDSGVVFNDGRLFNKFWPSWRGASRSRNSFATSSFKSGFCGVETAGSSRCLIETTLATRKWRSWFEKN